VLLQSDLIALLDEALNQKAILRKGGIQALYFCKCGHRKRKLEVNLERLISHCWVCDFRGTLGQLLKFFDAPPVYRDRLFALTKDFRQVKKEPATSSEVILPPEFWPLSKNNNSIEYKNALSYLKRRNLSREDILRYNIGYCESGEYEGYIIFPSYDASGKLNFFVGRKYHEFSNQVSYKKAKVSMNIIGFECFINWNEPINLCEGVFDAISIKHNAIPLFGKFLQSKLLYEIDKNKVKQVNIVLDNDALNDAVNNCLKIQRVNSDIKINIIKLDGKDPSVVGYSKIHDLINNSSQFKFEDLLLHKLKV
jgi:hypothetical protein